MRTKCFILGSAMVLCSLASQFSLAQQVARIGFISSSTTSVTSPFLAAFKEGMSDLGYEEGKHYIVEYRFGKSVDELSAMAADLVKRKVNIILGGG